MNEQNREPGEGQQRGQATPPPAPQQYQPQPPPEPQAPQQYQPQPQYPVQQPMQPPVQYPPQYPQQQQYPQQPYQASGQPAPQQGAPYAPWMQQPAPGFEPPKRGLSVGAWIGIIGGALLLVGAAVAVVLLVIVPGMKEPDVVAGGDTTTSRTTTSTPPSPSPSPSPSPTPPSTGSLGLDDVASFTAGPFWGVPFDAEWSIVRFDVEGFNEFSNDALQCRFLTFQGFGDPSVTDPGDRAASENTVAAALRIGLPWTGATGEPNVVPNGSRDIMAMAQNHSGDVEMMRLLATYSTASGDRERHILIRTFMPANAALYAEVDCPAGMSDVAEDLFDEMYVTDF